MVIRFMSGKQSGVRSGIKELARQAFYVNGCAHILNAFLVDKVKVAPQADCFFTFLQRLDVFMSATYVNTKWLNIHREMCDRAPGELQRLSETRRTRGKSFREKKRTFGECTEVFDDAS